MQTLSTQYSHCFNAATIFASFSSLQKQNFLKITLFQKVKKQQPTAAIYVASK